MLLRASQGLVTRVTWVPCARVLLLEWHWVAFIKLLTAPLASPTDSVSWATQTSVNLDEDENLIVSLEQISRHSHIPEGRAVILICRDNPRYASTIIAFVRWVGLRSSRKGRSSVQMPLADTYQEDPLYHC